MTTSYKARESQSIERAADQGPEAEALVQDLNHGPEVIAEIVETVTETETAKETDPSEDRPPETSASFVRISGIGLTIAPKAMVVE